jgi:phospholipid-binding lipoprotein MlaA
MKPADFCRITILISTIVVSQQGHALIENDPYENLNRGTYKFNKIADGVYIKPVANAYDKVLPMPAKATVSNVIQNLGEIPVVANGILQGKFKQAISDTVRFGVNSTLGIFGMFDVASEMGLKAHKEDLGKTFHSWGWKDSNYFVIPILGPSTVRDTVGIIGNVWLAAPAYFKPKLRNEVYVVTLIDKRQDLHEIDAVTGVAGVEYYNLVRSAYFQHREYEFEGGTAEIGEGFTPAGELEGPPA